MSDKEQITEEFAWEIFHSLGFPEDETTDYIEALQYDGYIKKSDLEIQAELFYNLNPSDVNFDFCIDYIEELEKEIERLKK